MVSVHLLFIVFILESFCFLLHFVDIGIFVEVAESARGISLNFISFNPRYSKYAMFQCGIFFSFPFYTLDVTYHSVKNLPYIIVTPEIVKICFT